MRLCQNDESVSAVLGTLPNHSWVKGLSSLEDFKEERALGIVGFPE